MFKKILLMTTCLMTASLMASSEDIIRGFYGKYGRCAEFVRIGSGPEVDKFAQAIRRTQEIISANPTFAPGEKYDLEHYVNFPNTDRRRLIFLKRFAKTTFKVTSEDTYAAAIHLEMKGAQKVAALDFANEHSPGGGVASGAKAQEEDMCRTSTLIAPLLKARVARDDRSFIAEHGALFAPNVLIFNEDKSRNNGNDFRVSVIVSAAYDLNPRHQQGMPANYEEGTKEKIRAQLRVAAMHKQDTLVLGAYGCGAFRNDPNFMASAYAEILAESEFKGVFKRITFAILGKGPGDANFDAFNSIFENYDPTVWARSGGGASPAAASAFGGDRPPAGDDRAYGAPRSAGARGGRPARVDASPAAAQLPVVDSGRSAAGSAFTEENF